MPSAKQPTVAEASPSPPPLPNEPLPGPSAPVDEPITQLGEADDEEDDEDDSGDEWDPAEERLPGEETATKGKGKEKATGEPSAGVDQNQPWQAVWSPEKNAWYFWNTKTSEVTWTNPLQPPPPASTSTKSAPAPFQPPLPAGPPPPSGRTILDIGMPAGIDPDLAHLLPPDQRGSAPGSATGAQTALFNSRTGRFTPADYAYTVDHLDEYNRAKRMASHYFDVDAWEKQRAEENAKKRRDEAAGIEPKKITKKDMERFRRKAAEKKTRSQAWLRD